MRHCGFALFIGVSISCTACGDTSTGSTIQDPSQDVLVLTGAQVKSLDSTGQVMVQANPGNADLKSLVDSTLLVLTAGVEAKRINVSTNLTTVPLYFVGVHRAVSRSSGSYSTWTVVGFDDPSKLANLIEVNGFAQTAGTTPPVSVTGTIGDGTGIVNGMLLQVASGGAITQWRANAGSAKFASDPPGVACPGFTPTVKVTCALETMHVQFTATASTGTGGAGARQASVSTDVVVPTMRLAITP